MKPKPVLHVLIVLSLSMAFVFLAIQAASAASKSMAQGGPGAPLSAPLLAAGNPGTGPQSRPASQAGAPATPPKPAVYGPPPNTDLDRFFRPPAQAEREKIPYKNNGTNQKITQGTPELSLNKWNGIGAARPGGVFVYGIDYGNKGDAAAENTIITDTLPVSTTYAGDTSDLTHAYNPATGVITWYVGALDPGGPYPFAVVVDVPESGLDTIEANRAKISTTTSGDSLEGNYMETGPVNVSPDDVDVGIQNMWAAISDPKPGEETSYGMWLCNYRGAAAGPLVLTDTLPENTTFLSWSWDSSIPFFKEVSHDNGRLVLEAPGLPGRRCLNININLRLDAGIPYGTGLANLAELSTAGDVNLQDNTRFDNSAAAGPDRVDLRMESYGGGATVPGNDANLHFNYTNNGNVPTPAWVTVTLPAGFTYVAGSGYADQGYALEPVVVQPGYLVWDLGEQPVFGGNGVKFKWHVADTVIPGTYSTCATAGSDNPDEQPEDNTSCEDFTLTIPGPNLWVVQAPRWNGDANLGYDIWFGNSGDESVDAVRITDTLPLSTTWFGSQSIGFDGSRVTGPIYASGVLTWGIDTLAPGEAGSLYFDVDLDDPQTRPQWFTNTLAITTPPGDPEPESNRNVQVTIKPEVDRVEMWIEPGVNMWGVAQPNSPLTVTTPSGTYHAWVDGGGNWGFFDPNGDIQPGDEVIVKAGAGRLPVVTVVPDPYTAQSDSSAEQVTGQVGGADRQRLDVNGYWGGGYRLATTDGEGNYAAHYWDVPRGGRGDVRYEIQQAGTYIDFHKNMTSPDLVLRVNYGQDWVEGYYEGGHTVWITLTNSLGFLKGSAKLESGAVPWWGGQTGFSTNWQGWDGNQPDIQVGDWIYGKVDNGAATQVQIGEISGNLDGGADYISGTVSAPWFSQMLSARCEIWSQTGGPTINFNVDPQGGSYACDYAALGFDITPADPVGVTYIGEDQNEVINVFQMPAPNIGLNLWADGDPGAGGNFMFYIQQNNWGSGPAEAIVVTSTLEGNVSYLSDTSGQAPDIRGGYPDPLVLVWHLGTLDPNSYPVFGLFLQVDGGQGDLIRNTTQIATSNPYNQGGPDQRVRTWEGTVQANATELNIGTWSWTGDPAPGYDFVLVDNLCNNGSTGSSAVLLTDTLPVSTTLVDWWAESGVDGWSLVSSSSSELVLTRPSVAGYRCDAVDIRVHLSPDAWPGMTISNTATIAAANDLDPSNNQSTWWANVNNAHTNLVADTWWNWGSLTPGGTFEHHIHYANYGNTSIGATILITDFLPANTSFLRSYRNYGWNQYPFAPVEVTDDHVVWQVDGLGAGFNGDFEVLLAIDPAAPVGAALVDTVAISPQPAEDSYDDNTSTFTETVYPHGPNLRVRKTAWWDDWGWDTRRIHYNLNIENIGDAMVRNFTVTDTYPADTYLDGGIGGGFDNGSPWNWTDDPDQHQIIFTYDTLRPTENMGFDYGTLYSETGAPPDSNPAWGMVFTNTADASLSPGDTNPADNHAEAMVFTGPDYYVEKSLASGVPMPGEVITFNLRIGNRQQGNAYWWDPMPEDTTIITDTLPDGLEFVSSTLRYCGGPEPCDLPPTNIAGNTLTWVIGPHSSGSWNEIRVAARLTGVFTPWEVLSNQADVASSRPDVNIEPFYANNHSRFDFNELVPYFDVSKTFQSSQVAGTGVVYTLTVDNAQGTALGTGLKLVDPLPAGVTYTEGDGSFAQGQVTWDIPSLEIGASQTAWFAGTLACTPGAEVSNAGYQVESSDQGASSLPGEAVAFTILAPTIQAGFSATPAQLVAGGAVAVADASTTNGTALAAWKFDFGDGSDPVYAKTASHTYTADGSFDIRLTVTDTCGLAATHTAAVTVAPPALNAAFTFSPTPAQVLVGQAVSFFDASTTDGPDIAAWEWDFGDGGTSTEQNPAHIYHLPGAYTVTLTVTDGLGYSDTEVKTQLVVVAPLRIFLPFITH